LLEGPTTSIGDVIGFGKPSQIANAIKAITSDITQRTSVVSKSHVGKFSDPVGNSAESICALAFGVLNFAKLAAFESLVFEAHRPDRS